jgi:hypothetical protein
MLHTLKITLYIYTLSEEMKPQDKASSSYVHRKLQKLLFVKNLNTNKYRSLKENTLTPINFNKTLEITSKLKNIDKKDIDAVQTFIKTVQARIQDKIFMPLKYTDPRGSRYFSLLPLYKVDSKSIQHFAVWGVLPFLDLQCPFAVPLVLPFLFLFVIFFSKYTL